MITVMGATGNTGKKIAETLLNAGENVRRAGPIGKQTRRTRFELGYNNAL